MQTAMWTNQYRKLSFQIRLEIKCITFSNIGAFISVIKCVVGTGVLALPLAFQYAGTILGPLLLIATAFVLIHGIQMLVITDNPLNTPLIVTPS